jgi:VCBS repeat-containing protein
MQLVTGGGTTPGTGVLIGAIYTGGVTTNRVAGAVVTVNGQSVTTAADGVYQFTLAPGSYTASVSKSGFTTTQVTRTVATGAQVWGSMELVPVVAGPGTLSGTVVASGAPVDGATVTVNGQSVTTAAAGTFSFSLAAGSYTVTATKSGFMQAQATQAVSSGQTATVTLTLTAVSGPDTVPPTVTLSAPVAGASLELAVVDVKGTAADDRGPVTSVSLSLNGSVGLDVPVMNGAFSVPLQLAPGRNDVVVTARDAAGNQAQANVAATFNAGLAGVVQLSGDATKPVAGATVELRDAATGTIVATNNTDAAGAFFTAATNVPADYLLVVRAPGYVTLTQTETVTADAQAHVVLSLVPGVDVIGELSVELTEPADGSTVLTDTVTVYGAVHGFDAGGVRVNGVVATLLDGGGFSATVPLVEGSNTLEVLATGLRGEAVSTRVTVRRPRTTPLEPVVGSSCSQAPGLLGVLAVLVLARRRRAARG